MKTFTTKEALKKHWEKHVQKGIQVATSLRGLQMKIAEIAVSACDIQLGGGAHWSGFINQYTIARFAEEINVHPKTLSNWTLIYRNVYLKLEDDVKEQALNSNFTALQKTARLCNKKTTKNHVNDTYKYFLDESKNKRIKIVNELLKRCDTFVFHASKSLVGVPDNKIDELEARLVKALKYIEKCREVRKGRKRIVEPTHLTVKR